MKQLVVRYRGGDDAGWWVGYLSHDVDGDFFEPRKRFDSEKEANDYARGILAIRAAADSRDAAAADRDNRDNVTLRRQVEVLRTVCRAFMEEHNHCDCYKRGGELFQCWSCQFKAALAATDPKDGKAGQGTAGGAE